MHTFFLSLLMVPPSGEQQGNPIFSLLPLVAIIGIFYFLILRPQSKRNKDTQQMRSSLKKGDRVVTIGGIHGVIQSVRESTLIIKVDENVKLEFNREAVSSVSSSAKEDKEDKKVLEDKADESSEADE